jgi:hypothetical protein
LSLGLFIIIILSPFISIIYNYFICISAGDSLISRMATQQELDAGRDWTHGVHQESHTRLEYEYRMICAAHYFGKDCDTLCRPRDDQFGHYTCGNNGDKICLDGWQKDRNNEEGDYCTKGKLKLLRLDFLDCVYFAKRVKYAAAAIRYAIIVNIWYKNIDNVENLQL